MADMDQPSHADVVDEASRDSFPASDAPAWTPVMGPLAARVDESAQPSAVLRDVPTTGSIPANEG